MITILYSLNNDINTL